MSSETVSDERLDDLVARLRLQSGTRQFLVTEETALEAANAIESLRSKPVASGVEVKPLEWKGPDENTAYGEQGGFVYTVMSPNRTPGWRVWVHLKPPEGLSASVGGAIITVKAESRDAAIAAAEADYCNRITSALLPKATAPVVSEPVAWQVRREGNVEWSTVSARDVNGYSDRYERRPLYTSPQLQLKAVTEELDGADLQTLMQLKRDNVWDGARPVLENSIADEMRRAFALSERGLIALEQVARGVRLHITRKGVAALEAFVKEA